MRARGLYVCVWYAARAAWMKMPMQSCALCIYIFASHAHTHTLSAALPARALARNYEACLQLCAFAFAFACAIIAFLHIICLLSSICCFLFIFVDFFKCACVCERRRQLCQRRCLRRVHKCKFTRTFEMCSHSGTKTFINALRRGLWAAQCSGKEVALGNEMMEYSGTIISVCLIYIYIISLYVQRLYIVLAPFAYYAWECMRNGNS